MLGGNIRANALWDYIWRVYELIMSLTQVTTFFKTLTDRGTHHS